MSVADVKTEGRPAKIPTLGEFMAEREQIALALGMKHAPRDRKADKITRRNMNIIMGKARGRIR